LQLAIAQGNPPGRGKSQWSGARLLKDLGRLEPMLLCISLNALIPRGTSVLALSQPNPGAQRGSIFGIYAKVQQANSLCGRRRVQGIL
jgi:hypothetical protein